MTVRHLENSIDTNEFLEWQALYRIENEENEEQRIAAESRAGAERAKARPRPQ